jgi:hypothetical protein
VDLREEIEATLRAWNAYELNRGSPAVIDFDCHPTDSEPAPAANRLEVYRRLTDLHGRAEQTGQARLATRLGADLAYLAALLGERLPLTDYIQATQGCGAAGWQDGYITARADHARQALAALGINWGPGTGRDFIALEGPIDTADAPDAIRQAAAEYEPAVRDATGSAAPFELTIESVDVDAYWSYWLDGAGHRVRLRLNLRTATFTKNAARQFALHEVLGHGLQGASWSARCITEDVPWPRMSSVHAQQQVLLEGLAQAMPLFIAPDDETLITRVRLDHYTQLVRGELHLALNQGATITECADHARFRVPWWTDAQIADILTDRGTNPQLRSYLWAYPAGFDWFTNLADTADPATKRDVLHAAYRDPLTPDDLAALWPAGPTIGGTGA